MKVERPHPAAPEIGIAMIWFGGIAQAVGLPIAWLRVRKTAAWRERPRHVRRIDLLAEFIRTAVEATLVWTFLMMLLLFAGVVLHLSAVTVAGAVLLVAGPLLFVPWIVLSLDVRDFERQVEDLRRRFEDVRPQPGRV